MARDAGHVTGLLPFSRLTHYPGTARANGASRLAALHKSYFPEMLQRLPVLQGRLVSLLADRVRASAVSDLQQEKLMALGKLSAGLAHELNNPASAARRAADNLRKALTSVRAASLKLDREGFPLESRVFLAELERDWAKNAGPQSALDTLERSDREEELSAWLADHHIEAVWDLATALVDLGCTRETLESVASHVPERFLNDVLVRITAAFTISRLADEIEHSTGRISELVRSIKEYSYMDQGPEQQVDIHHGLENTLVMLRHRLKSGIEVVRDYDRSIPEIRARGSELNQVWTNLLVNAIDAICQKEKPTEGKLTIRTSRDDRYLHIEIIDNGSGIPDRDQEQDFRAILHDQTIRRGHRPRSRHRFPHCAQSSRGYQVRLAARFHELRSTLADRGGLKGAYAVFPFTAFETWLRFFVLLCLLCAGRRTDPRRSFTAPHGGARW